MSGLVDLLDRITLDTQRSVCVLLMMLTIALLTAEMVAPDKRLVAQAQGAFKAGDTLPRLTRYDWPMPEAARIRICEEWECTLEFAHVSTSGPPFDDGMVYGSTWRLNDPNSGASRMAALAKSDPVRHPRVVQLSQAVDDLDGDELIGAMDLGIPLRGWMP